MTYSLVILFCLVSNPNECVLATAGPELIPQNMSAQFCAIVGQQVAAVLLNETDTMVDGKGPYALRSYSCVAGTEA